MRGQFGNEQGMSMPSVMMAMVIVAMIIGIISTLTLRVVGNSRETRDRSMSVAVVETGASKLQLALRSMQLNVRNGYWPSGEAAADAMMEQLRGSGSRIAVAGRADAVREPINVDAGSSAEWRVERVLAPLPGTSRSVVAFVRARIGEGTGAGAYNLYRVELQNTPLSSFQFVSDGELVFERGARITGNAHANGNTPSGSTVGAIRVMDNVSCENNPRVSTGTGDVVGASAGAAPSLPGCRVKSRTGRHINFGDIPQHVERIVRMCQPPALPVVRCTGTAGAGHRYRVELRADSLVCHGCGGSMGLASSASASVAPGEVLVVRGHVDVHGSTRGRVTIIAWDDATGDAETIRIIGDLGREGRGVVGLVAAGNVEILVGDDGTFCPVHNVTAAIASYSGRLQIPSHLLSASGVVASPCPGTFTLTGSVATRHGAVLTWTSPDGTAGWAGRRYQFDRSLNHTPPPHFPEAYRWGTTNVRRISPACLSLADPVRARDCT